MSFLLQTNDDFVKFQLRTLLIDPDKKKEVKKKLRCLGLYSNRNGFGTYRDFFQTEIGNTAKPTRRARHASLMGIPGQIRKKTTKSQLPSLVKVKPDRSKGILNSEFFKRGRFTIGSCTLFMLISKLNVLPASDLEIPKLSKKYENDFNLQFVPYYLRSFFCVSEHINKVLPNIIMNYTQEIKKIVSSTYTVISAVGGNRKVFVRNKDFRIILYLSSKPWINIVTEPLQKFFFKKYSLFNEQTFEDFIGNYVFTHNVQNQKRICFELYDRLGNQYITSKHLFAFFESPIFPLIKGDLFAMINYLSNDRYSEETTRLSRANTRIVSSEIFKAIASEPKRLNFKAFSKLNFEQKFPDMLLALAYSMFDETGSNFITTYYSIAKYKVTTSDNNLNLARPVNICKDYIKIAKVYYDIIKPDIKSYQPRGDQFTKELLKGAVVTFMLACNAEYLCEFRQLGATATSLVEGSLVVFGKMSTLLMERIFANIVIPNTQKITLWEFLDYIEGFFYVISIKDDDKHIQCFNLYDANKDGVVSVLEMINVMDSGDYALSTALEEEIAKLAEVMESKRHVTQYGGGFIDQHSYEIIIPDPAFPQFLRERLIFNYKNMNVLYQKRYEELMTEHL